LYILILKMQSPYYLKNAGNWLSSHALPHFRRKESLEMNMHDCWVNIY
jgi:hypothetical protein